jgi:hypothetical protein
MATQPRPETEPDSDNQSDQSPPAPAPGPHRPYQPAHDGIADTGAFMCHQSTEPTVERVDVPAQSDLKQEAVLRLLEYQAAHGGEICTACEQLVNRDAGLAWTGYARARVDFYRSRRGRGGVKARIEALDEAVEQIGEVCDERQDAPVESRRIVRRIVRERLPGISERRLQRVMVVMVEAQDIKRSKRTVMPDKLRAALTRLRKATGLPLDTSLL